MTARGLHLLSRRAFATVTTPPSPSNATKGGSYFSYKTILGLYAVTWGAILSPALFEDKEKMREQQRAQDAIDKARGYKEILIPTGQLCIPLPYKIYFAPKPAAVNTAKPG
jgi:hypothetical protein